MAGEFFTQYFGSGHENLSGEMTVRCPFLHDKGYELNPSAHVNIDKELFHCKTCEAEGRPTGFSETSFIAHLYDITYSEAIEYMTSYVGKETEEDWGQAVFNLQTSQKCIDFLTSRGITLETATEYKLGMVGNGVVYPVFVNDVLLDKRTYHFDHDETGGPKITSERGASVLLFPFDHWVNDERPTLLCAGENDTLLARQMGFNAITATMGEGSFPRIFLKLFKDKEVFVCYDCDEAGKKSAGRVAFHLYSSGARVRIVNLGLSGAKSDKDVTDFFLKHNHSADDLYKLMQQAYSFTGEMYQEEKNRLYPLVPLWDATEVKYTDKYISSRVMMMGKYETSHGPFMQIPSAIHFTCDGPHHTEDGEMEDACKRCPLRKTQEHMWILNTDELDKVIDLVENDDNTTNKTMQTKLGRIPYDCSGDVKHVKRDRVNVQRVIFAPDVESETELRGYRSAEIQAYVLRPRLEDGQRYRIFFKQYAHPKNHAVLLIVDRVEESDNAINSFHMTNEIIQQLSQFQGHPKDVMQKRFDMAKLVISPSTPRQVQEAVDIIYHSVLDVRFAGVPLNKGYPEGAIVGESRTGKSETAKKLVQFYGLGNHTEIKNASVAGLIGGAESMKSTGYRIKWGKIPRNNRGLIILDEASGVTKEQLAHLTGVRSERKAVIEKIVSGESPASTRILWISNPREMPNGSSRPIEMYPTGVDVVVDLFGTDQDVARLDFAIVLPKNEAYIPPFRDLDELENIDSAPYRNLVRWAWSRTIDQVKFASGVEQYIWQTSQELNEQYDTHVKLFGAEAYKKLARIAVSIAVMCFSHDGTGDIVLVSKDHVDYARDFLIRCYDNTVFRLRDYVEQQRLISETTEEANNEFEKLVRTQPLLVKTLNSNAEISTYQLQMLTGIEKQQFSDMMARMLQTGLITASSSAIAATLRFKKARDAYMSDESNKRMIPLSQQGGLLL